MKTKKPATPEPVYLVMATNNLSTDGERWTFTQEVDAVRYARARKDDYRAIRVWRCEEVEL